MNIAPARRVLNFFLVPVYACCTGSDKLLVQRPEALHYSARESSLAGNYKKEAIEAFIKLCKRSDITRLVIDRDGLRITEKNLNRRGKEKLDTMSVTKAVTGLVAVMALDKINISLSENANVPESGHAGVTFEQVLSHSSGLRLPEEDQVGQIYKSRDFSSLFRRAEVRFQPGSKSEYSNLAVNLLSLAIESKTGKEMATYAHEHLFTPIGINDEFWETDGSGHSFAMAGLHLRADDMIKLSFILLNGGVYGGKQVVPLHCIRSLWRPSQHLIEDSIGGRVSWRYLWAQTYFDLPAIDPDTREPLTAPDLLSANGYGGQYIIALRKSRLQIVTQRDMEFDKAAPVLGGYPFLDVLRRLDDAFSRDPGGDVATLGRIHAPLTPSSDIETSSDKR